MNIYCYKIIFCESVFLALSGMFTRLSESASVPSLEGNSTGTIVSSFDLASRIIFALETKSSILFGLIF